MYVSVYMMIYYRCIFQYIAGRFKLWESTDKRQRSDRLSVRVPLCIGLHLLNYDESLYCGARYFF